MITEEIAAKLIARLLIGFFFLTTPIWGPLVLLGWGVQRLYERVTGVKINWSL